MQSLRGIIRSPTPRMHDRELHCLNWAQSAFVNGGAKVYLVDGSNAG